VALCLDLSKLGSRSSGRPNPVSRLSRVMARGGVRLPPWPVALVLVSAVSIGSSVPVEAHEPGTTRVIASFSADRTYAIELTTDASTLLARLEAARKQPRSSPATIADYRRGFAALCDEIGRHLDASFDGTRVLIAPTCTVDDAVTGLDPALASLGVTVRFDGPIPAGASHFTWQYDLTYATYALMIVSSDGTADETLWLEGGQVSPVALLDRVAVPVARTVVVARYLLVGFTHVLPNGLEHILFVLGLFLLNRRLRSIVWQVGAFSLAHAVAFGLTSYGAIAFPTPSIEPLIALSIVYVAVGNIVASELRAWRIALVFICGLLHGARLAGTLHQIPLPPSELLLGLLSIVAGVQAAQLVLMLLASATVGRWARPRDGYRRIVAVPASALIATVALFWAVERLTS
jgi:hypothetical protein